jgi:tetratricopeptide (TPR) repeat protein
MIELLLVADQLLAAGELDRAERIYAQVAEADPRNAIAVVGLARVAEARGSMADVADLARRALAIDPEDDAAGRLIEVATAALLGAGSIARDQRRLSILSRVRAWLGLGR